MSYINNIKYHLKHCILHAFVLFRAQPDMCPQWAALGDRAQYKNDTFYVMSAHDSLISGEIGKYCKCKTTMTNIRPYRAAQII